MTGRSYHSEHIISELKRDYRFSLFYLSPRLYPDVSDWKELAQKMNLPMETAAPFADRLLTTGLWSVGAEGAPGILVTRDHLDLGELSLGEFMSMSLALTARMQDNGPAWYETFFVVTDAALKKKFYRKVNAAIREFIDESRAVEGDTVVGWTHSGLDCLGDLDREGGK